MNRQVDVKALVSHIVRGDGMDKCRICMGDTSEGQVYLGDTVMMDGERAVSLSELLEIITGIEVPLEEDLPAGVCTTCAQRALEAASFRTLCRQAVDQWDTTIHLLKNLPSKYLSQTMYIVINNDESVTIVDDLKALDPKFAEELTSKTVWKEKAKEIKHKCQCPDCGKKFLYPQLLYLHLKESTDLRRACYVCAKIMMRDDLITHLKSIHCLEVFDCKKCPAVVRSRKQLARHIEEAHGAGACTCGDCGRSFKSKPAFNAHLSVHVVKTCPACDKVFRNQTCYLYHVRKCCEIDLNRKIHRTKNRVTIEVKNRKSERRTRVGLRGAADTECICDYCGKKFAGKKFITAHIQIVHLKNTHRPCQYCGKFLAAAHMGEHLKKHELETIFTCEYCGIVLKTKLGYVQHIRLHTGEKPYTCGQCGETFSASSRRSDHIRKIHKSVNILKYTCEFCPARFQLPYKLRNHVSTVHNKEDVAAVPFSCKICMEKFSSCRGLTHHSRKHQKVHKVDLKGFDKLESIESVAEDAALPQGLCRACAEDAIAAAHFRQLSTLSHDHWHQATTSLSQIHDPEDDNRTFYVFYSENGDTLIREELRKSIPTNEVVVSLNKKTKKGKKRAYNKSSGKCQCPDCGKDFPVAYNLNVHLKNTMKRACIRCGEVLERERLADHLAKVHGKLYADCDICFKLFEHEESLKQHYMTHHSRFSYGCQICGRGYTNDRALRAHMYAHTLFHCMSCTLSFENRRCFKHHQKKCKSARMPTATSFICDYCGHVYNKKPSLRIHIIQKHLNVLPYVCETCGKRTSTLAHLRSHEAIHTTERKLYKCACGAEMRTVLGYHLHQRIHTGEKPYECEECGDRFLSASRRLDHVKRRHRSTKDMPHGCDVCQARFVRPFELKKHYASVHDSVVNVLPAKKRIRRQLADESLCPGGVCAACTASAIAAQEFLSFVTDSYKIWSYAITQLDTLPAHHTPTVKSLCAFLRPDNLNIQVTKDYSLNETITPLNRLKTRINRKKTDEKKPRVHRAGPPCKCTDCGKEFISPYYLNVHFKNSGQKDACITCGAILLRGKEMRDHIVKVHKENAFLCKECPALFNNEADAKQHEKKAHKTGLTCGDCGRTFLRNASFETHSQMHAVRTCRACGIQFTNRACYREHRSKCEPDAKPDRDTVPRSRRSNIRDPATFTCDYCKKTYTSRPQLKNHILWIHMDVRPHQCQWCGKRFYTPARLAEHSVVHTRERNFGCDICGAKLVSKMAAVYHRRRHTGEKPYRCDDCGDCFISASRRSEHAKRKHGKGPRLHCTRCPSSFVRIHELRKHIEKAHSHNVPVFVDS